MKSHLSPETFRLPIEKIRAGYKSDVYFNRTAEILRKDKVQDRVTMQVFQKVDNAVLCGVDHALAILHAGTGHYKDQERAAKLFQRYLDLEKKAYKMWLNIGKIAWKDYEKVGREIFNVSNELDRLWENTYSDLRIRTLFDGDIVGNRETVMLLEGKLADFAPLETLYLGALTDGTCVATNTRRVVEAADGAPILMFGARHKSHESQAGDGYAAMIGGASGGSTHEQGEYYGGVGRGTIPHALIATYGGNTTLATLKFDRYINEPKKAVDVVSLVDFNNDSVGTSLEVARALEGKLWGVRLDTSENMIDKSVWEAIQRRAIRSEGDVAGVNPTLVRMVREALDREGFEKVKIVASGGFNPEKIKKFKRMNVPVDVYGVGSAIFAGSGGTYDFTADVVKPVGKVGRMLHDNPRLHMLV